MVIIDFIQKIAAIIIALLSGFNIISLDISDSILLDIPCQLPCVLGVHINNTKFSEIPSIISPYIENNTVQIRPRGALYACGFPECDSWITFEPDSENGIESIFIYQVVGNLSCSDILQKYGKPNHVLLFIDSYHFFYDSIEVIFFAENYEINPLVENIYIRKLEDHSRREQILLTEYNPIIISSEDLSTLCG